MFFSIVDYYKILNIVLCALSSIILMHLVIFKVLRFFLTLESEKWKWKLLSRVRLFGTQARIL